MNDIFRKSNEIFHQNIKWLISSDIRIKNGYNKGALYGWMNLNPVSFPFIYSEITGYGISCFSWIYSKLGNPNALEAAVDCSKWIIKNMKSYMLVARPAGEVKSDPINNQYYAFDNGMIIIGLLNLYKITNDIKLIDLAQHMAIRLIDLFFDGTKLRARLDESCNPINYNSNDGVIKWSTVAGSYHSKISIALLELTSLTGNKFFKKVSDSICDYSISLQKSDGQFITNPGSAITYLHPHLYACEGLMYSGLSQSNNNHHSAALKGLCWAMKQTYNTNGGLPSTSEKGSVEQSDCTAQLLRLLILCRFQIQKYIDSSELENVIKRLHMRLLDFYVPVGEGRGAMRYHLKLDSACSWCTMFAIQALYLWTIRNSTNLKWIDYFV